MKPLLRPNGYDALLALAVVVLAVLSGFALWRPAGGGGDLLVEVSQNGQVLDRFLLEELADGDRIYEGNGYTLTAALSPEGGVCVASSDCPSRDCVRMGSIRQSGESIVCLPARMVLRLTGGAEGDVDAVIG